MQVTEAAAQAINELVAVRAEFYKKLELVEKELGLPNWGIEVLACESVIDSDFADRTGGLNHEEVKHFINELVEV